MAIKEAGSMQGAAKLLGLSYSGLRSLVQKDPELRAKYTRPRKSKAQESKELDDPVDQDMVELGRIQHIKQSNAEALLQDKQVSEALTKENENLKEGLTSIGLSPLAIKSAESLQKFHNTHFTRAVEIIGGGMTKTFVEIMACIDDINVRLEEGGMTLEEEQMLRQDRSRLLEIQGRTYDRSLKASMTQAVIQHKLSEGSPDKPSRGKPGFRPIINAIKIEAQNVKVLKDG